MHLLVSIHFSDIAGNCKTVQIPGDCLPLPVLLLHALQETAKGDSSLLWRIDHASSLASAPAEFSSAKMLQNKMVVMKRCRAFEWRLLFVLVGA